MLMHAHNNIKCPCPLLRSRFERKRRKTTIYKKIHKKTKNRQHNKTRVCFFGADEFKALTLPVQNNKIQSHVFEVYTNIHPVNTL